MSKPKSAPHFALPKAVLNHPNYAKLTPYGVKLLCDLGEQFRGFNNGDLCATIKLMKPKGWRSSATLHSARKELLYYGFIELTQQGGKHRSNLYALTWHPIDECKGKLDVRPTKKASGLWKTEKPKYEPPTAKQIKKRGRNMNQLGGIERVNRC